MAMRNPLTRPLPRVGERSRIFVEFHPTTGGHHGSGHQGQGRYSWHGLLEVRRTLGQRRRGADARGLQGMPQGCGHRPEPAPGGVVLYSDRRGPCRQVGHSAVDDAAASQHPGDACREYVRFRHRGLPRRLLRGGVGRGRLRAGAGRREAQGHRLRRPAGRPRRSAAGPVERQRHGPGQLRPARHGLHDRARRPRARTSRRRSAMSRGRATRTAPRTRRPICRRPSRWTPS